MRNDLHRAAQIIAFALFGKQGGVDASCRHVVAAPGIYAGEALVMAQIQIGLRAVFGDKHLAMLGGVHCAGIDIEVGVKFAQAYFKTARLEQRGKACRREPFTQ